MSTVCPCKGCENRSIYCHSECIEYTRWRDNLDQLKKKDKQNQDAASYVIESINRKRRQSNHLKRRTSYDQ